MNDRLSRRGVARVSLGLAAGAVIASIPANAQAAGRSRGPNARDDARAMELWHAFDQDTYHRPVPAFAKAMDELHQKLGDQVEGAFLTSWRYHMRAGTYPQSFAARMKDFKDQLSAISQTELAVFDRFFGEDFKGLTRAFSTFGQGTLFDPREEQGNQVHTMNYGPNGSAPLGYHIWHAFIRAMAETGIDADRWNQINPLVGFAWALQTAAKPSVATPNPGLPHDVVHRLAHKWLRMDQQQLDQEFMSIPYPNGMS
ncbi:hypothetical protein ACH4E7_36970 [Kitasatospora sp. NPDC018058]|uniref:hypothetical protein n=1 Tax=Kitasatospora sp. NPDC018058 TaxID=3364025 RepID=UPI0037BE40A1